MLTIILSLCAALGFSISDICSKYLLENGLSNLQYLFWSHGVLFLSLTILFMIIGTSYSLKFLTNGDGYNQLFKLPSGKLLLILLLATITSFMGLVVLIYAFKIAKNIGYISAVVGTTSLITFILSWLFFGKKPELIGILGALSILFGVYLISKCDN